MITRLRLWWRAVVQRRRFERELAAELDFHLQSRADALVAAGMPRHEALRTARIELGARESHADACRQARGLAWVDHLARDLRFALRGLRRNPGYSATALAVLGLALAANSLLFALFNAYALRNPPIERSERWVSVGARTEQQRVVDRWNEADTRQLLADPPPMFEGLYGFRATRLPVVAEVTRSVGAEVVTDNYFSLLGVRAVRGRVFAPGDAPGDAPGVVLSQLGWQRLLGGDPDVLGRSIGIAGRRFEVIGIAPPGFTGLTVESAQFWIRDADYPAPDRSAEDGIWWLDFDVGGFLREGASLAAAEEALAPRVLAGNAQRDEAWRLASVRVQPRRGYLRADELDEIIEMGIPVALAFAMLLLVAAANLGNLVLARFAARQRELAVRVAVGAPRGRLVVQLLAECVLLASGAAILGYGLAALTLDPVHAALFSLLGELGYDVIEVAIEPRVFGYGLAMALLAALCFGGIPALIATAPWKRGGMPDIAALQRAGSTRLRSALMVGQLAASVVLLVLASLAAGNARRAEATRLGYDPSRLVSIRAGLVDPSMKDAFEDMPQVAAAGASSHVPLLGVGYRIGARVEGRSEGLNARLVDSDFLEVMQLEVLRGRALRRSDHEDSRVVLISLRTAEKLWPGESPLGRTLELPADAEAPEQDAIALGHYEVVGVVEDIVSGWYVGGLDSTAVYFPARYGNPHVDSLMLRLNDTTPATLEALRTTCARARPEQDCELMPLTSAFRFQRLPFVVASSVAAALGWTALGISCLGLYGLVSYLVLQKRREIGVRLALGAQVGRVAREMLGGAARQIALGLVIGLPLAFGISRLAASFVPQLRSFDLASFLAVPLGLALLALLAAWIPARRTAGIAPTEALREE
jgi:predicted permease